MCVQVNVYEYTYTYLVTYCEVLLVRLALLKSFIDSKILVFNAIDVYFSQTQQFKVMGGSTSYDNPIVFYLKTVSFSEPRQYHHPNSVKEGKNLDAYVGQHRSETDRIYSHTLETKQNVNLICH